MTFYTTKGMWHGIEEYLWNRDPQYLWHISAGAILTDLINHDTISGFPETRNKRESRKIILTYLDQVTPFHRHGRYSPKSLLQGQIEAAGEAIIFVDRWYRLSDKAYRYRDMSDQVKACIDMSAIARDLLAYAGNEDIIGAMIAVEDHLYQHADLYDPLMMVSLLEAQARLCETTFCDSRTMSARQRRVEKRYMKAVAKVLRIMVKNIAVTRIKFPKRMRLGENSSDFRA